jgi:hypothetical protein
VHSVFNLFCSLKSTQGEWGLLRIKPRIPVVLYSSFMWWCILAINFTSLTLRTRLCMFMLMLLFIYFCILKVFKKKWNFFI